MPAKEPKPLTEEQEKCVKRRLKDKNVVWQAFYSAGEFLDVETPLNLDEVCEQDNPK